LKDSKAVWEETDKSVGEIVGIRVGTGWDEGDAEDGEGHEREDWGV
jgi:hypothetical protein